MIMPFMRYSKLLAPFILMLMLTPALHADVLVHAWARATPPGATSGAIYGVFSNTGDLAMRATGIGFEHARHVMVHRTVSTDGVTRMLPGELSMAPGETLQLAPGDLHIMLMGLAIPLVKGCRYRFSLIWENGETSFHDLVTGGYGQMTEPAGEGQACP